MDLLIGLLTIILVLNCLLLVLLILIQLPKKDAGAGLAFGGGATDALFGSGTGTVLTRATRYGATVFLILAMSLSVMQSYQAKASRQSILEQLETRAGSAPAASPSIPPDARPAGIDTAIPATPIELPTAGESDPALQSDPGSGDRP